MTVFSHYARYYDLLYRDKDYAAEVKFIHGLIVKYAPQTRSILELGCGTGAHAAVFAELGYRLHGVDRSPAMLDAAGRRTAGLGRALADVLSFSQGDIRTVRLGGSFDAVISLFHVLSYQTTNEDVISSFATAGAHLKPGGIFMFDCWYGPGVLADRPAVRNKRFEDDRITVSRTAEPSLDIEHHTTDVSYTIRIRDKQTGTAEEIREVHRMRHFFDWEIDSFAGESNFTVIQRLAWMSDHAPGSTDWNACFVLQKQ